MRKTVLALCLLGSCFRVSEQMDDVRHHELLSPRRRLARPKEIPLDLNEEPPRIWTPRHITNLLQTYKQCERDSEGKRNQTNWIKQELHRRFTSIHPDYSGYGPGRLLHRAIKILESRPQPGFTNEHEKDLLSLHDEMMSQRRIDEPVNQFSKELAGIWFNRHKATNYVTPAQLYELATKLSLQRFDEDEKRGESSYGRVDKTPVTGYISKERQSEAQPDSIKRRTSTSPLNPDYVKGRQIEESSKRLRPTRK